MFNLSKTQNNMRYNFLDIERNFKEYLYAGNKSKSTIKNYVSDLRHFLGWLQSRTKANLSKIIFTINRSTILEYRSSLQLEKTPIITINRRLSMLRAFFSFCISQQWLKDNPAKHVSNVLTPANDVQSLFIHAISEYIQEKEFQGESRKTVRSIRSTLNEFFNVIHLTNILYEK